jgi:hypothetical protein
MVKERRLKEVRMDTAGEDDEQAVDRIPVERQTGPTNELTYVSPSVVSSI